MKRGLIIIDGSEINVHMMLFQEQGENKQAIATLRTASHMDRGPTHFIESVRVSTFGAKEREREEIRRRRRKKKLSPKDVLTFTKQEGR